MDIVSLSIGFKSGKSGTGKLIAGDGISISENKEISVKLDGEHTNGLSISGEGVALDSASTSSAGAMSAADKQKLDTLNKGVANGVAELDSSGKVPASQLPSYVDDILEYTTTDDFPIPGESGKIYVSKGNNQTYRWSGTAYVATPDSIALGETSSTAYAGNKGKANADAITAIKDGTSIDSFGDVETALSGKIDTAGTGLSKSGTTLNHSNSVTAKTNTNLAGLSYDDQGHVTGKGTEYTIETSIPSSPTDTQILSAKAANNALSGKIDTAGTGLSKSGTTINHSNSVTAKTNTNLAGLSYDAQGHVTGKGTEYSVQTSIPSSPTDAQFLTAKAVNTALAGKIDTAGTGLSKSDTTINHSNSVTAKTNTNVSGLSYDAQGHITGKGTEYTVKTSIPSSPTDSQLLSAKAINTALSGKIDTAGTGLSKDKTTINHSNSVTAKSNTNIAGLSYDAQGHITGKGTEYTVQTSIPSSPTDSQILTAKASCDICKIEQYALQDVFDLTASDLILKISSNVAKLTCVTCLTDKNGVGIMQFGVYADSTVSQPGAGWKKLGLVYKDSFPYCHKPITDGNSGGEISRTLASMWVGNGYVNSVVAINSFIPSTSLYSFDTPFRVYYTSGMANQTGGFNMNVVVPIITKASLS